MITSLAPRLGKQRYMLYVAAQLLGACCGAALLRISLPPSYLETPFVTAGSLTAAHPVQVIFYVNSDEVELRPGRRPKGNSCNSISAFVLRVSDVL